MFKHISEEITCVMERDPAARSRFEVALLYPGFHSIVSHRIAHWLWTRKWRITARFLSQFSRFITGIEIHPGARIGRKFFMDHGTGIVVGETAEIGDNVTLYQGVTLGGVAPSIDTDSQRGVKRHPTLNDNVIIASGAQIIGPITVGNCARVGANSVVLKDVPDRTTVVGIPARAVTSSKKTREEAKFAAYGVGTSDLPDPVFKVMDGLLDKVQTLSMRVEELERENGSSPDTAHSLEGKKPSEKSTAPDRKSEL